MILIVNACVYCALYFAALLQTLDGEGADDHESTMSDVASSGIPLFQHQLMHFLDTKAPVLGKAVSDLYLC